jgi:transposase
MIEWDMKAYSSDLRERVLRAVDEGKPRAQIIELFHVSRATIKRYLKQRRETGNVQPRAIPGRTPKKGAALQAHLHELLQERSDARLEDYCQMWENRSGVKVSTSTMSRALRQEDYTRKKRHWQQANRINRSEQPGETKRDNSMPANWSLLTNVAPISL